MKDSEFIELLNLYLDHEISAADAARLEAEVQSNPARRRMYQDYCRMQKACKILAQDFTVETPAAADRKVVAFDAAGGTVRQGRKPWYFATGSLAAAAAAVAAVLVLRPVESGPASPVPTEVAAIAEPARAVQPMPAAEAPAEPARVLVASGIARRPVSALTLEQANAADQSLTLTPAQNDPRFAWMNEVRLAPLQMPTAEQFRLETTPVRAPQNRTFSSGNQPLPPDVLPIAIRFQK